MDAGDVAHIGRVIHGRRAQLPRVRELIWRLILRRDRGGGCGVAAVPSTIGRASPQTRRLGMPSGQLLRKIWGEFLPRGRRFVNEALVRRRRRRSVLRASAAASRVRTSTPLPAISMSGQFWGAGTVGSG